MLYAFLGLIIVIVVLLIGSYNGLIRLRQQVKEAFSTMDVYLKKRYDLIPNIVETVKGYAAHEQETLQKVIAARQQGLSASSLEEIKQSNNAITQGLRQLFALSENYPDLKANTNFLALQEQLSQIEGEIAQSRKYYNAVVRTFNTRCEVFPTVIIANSFGFMKEEYYLIDNDDQRENVTVAF